MKNLVSVFLLEMPGGGEMLLIIFFIIIFFGAKRIPELARGLGRGIREFKDASQGIRREIEDGIKSSEQAPPPKKPENNEPAA